MAWRGLRAPSLCSASGFPEHLALELRAGISGPGKPQTWVLPAAPYVLFIPHMCSHTQMLSAMEFPSWTGREECIPRPTIARKIIQPGPIPRVRRPWCRPDQSPRPGTSDQPPRPAAPLVSQNTLSQGRVYTGKTQRAGGEEAQRKEERKKALSFHLTG